MSPHCSYGTSMSVHTSLPCLTTLLTPPTIPTLMCFPFLPIMDSFTRQLQLKSDDIVFRVRKVSSHGQCHWPYNSSLFPNQICARVKLLSIALFGRFLHDKHACFRRSDPSSSPTALRALFRDWPLHFSLLITLFFSFSLTRSSETVRKNLDGRVTVSLYIRWFVLSPAESCHSVTVCTLIRTVSCRIMSQCHSIYVDSFCLPQNHVTVPLYIRWLVLSLAESCHSFTVYTLIRAVSCRIMSRCYCIYVDSCCLLQNHVTVSLYVRWFVQWPAVMSQCHSIIFIGTVVLLLSRKAIQYGDTCFESQTTHPRPWLSCFIVCLTPYT